MATTAVGQEASPAPAAHNEEEEAAVEEAYSQYDNFDMEAYTLRKEREVSTSLKGDTMYRAPTASSWLTWRVRLPSMLASLTAFVLIAYEVVVVIAMFVESVRRVMVDGGLMYALSALNLFLCVSLVVVVLLTRRDLGLGALTSKLSRGRTEVLDE